MSIEDLIRVWKADEEQEEVTSPANPVGEELSDQDLLEATGGMVCVCTCSGYTEQF